MSGKRQAQQRKGAAPELIRSYTVRLRLLGEVAAEQTVRENHQRLNTVDFISASCDEVELCIRRFREIFDRKSLMLLYIFINR